MIYSARYKYLNSNVSWVGVKQDSKVPPKLLKLTTQSQEAIYFQH